MTGPAYYNENDPKAAATLRELIREGLIAPGDVDERSIEDVFPIDLLGYTQCHFFAGFGIWSYAFRLAGWPDDRPVWSGSCPCQPFSAAGKGKGFADERHLWPAFFHLIQHGKPEGVPVYGEQVASPDGLAWLDIVCADLEAENHAVWPFDICAAGFGAPIIRQRLFWLACSSSFMGEPTSGGLAMRRGSQGDSGRTALTGNAGGLAGSHDTERRTDVARRDERDGCATGRDESDGELRAGELSCGMGIAIQSGLEGYSGDGDGTTGRPEQARPVAETGATCGLPGSDGRITSDGDVQRSGEYGFLTEDGGTGDGSGRPGPVNGFWRDADWLFCRDGKWRPVEPGTQPLAHGYPERVGILRGAGNAINAQAAKAFIEASIDVISN